MRIIFITILSIFGFLVSLKSQSISFTIVKAPCKGDGILKATVQGVNTFPNKWYWYYNGKGVTHNYISGMISDSIIDYSGGQVYVSFDTSIGGTSFYGNFNSDLPFKLLFNKKIENCPKPSSVEITTIGGTPPFSYEWFKNDNNVLTKVGTTNPINLSNGHFEVIVTDANGCTVDNIKSKQDSSYIYINAPSGFSYNVETTMANCTNGSATVKDLVGGKQPFTYQWSNGANSNSIQNLIAGNYPITVTDANGCSEVKYEVIIRQSKQISVQSTITPSNCKEADGAIIAFPSGGNAPYTYKWNNGETTQSIKNLVAGNYYVQATDKDGCFGENYAYLNTLTPVQVSIINTKQSSCTSPTGSATLSISGGKTPYNIEWKTSPKQTGTTLSNMSPGSYAFVVTDANNCERTGTVVIYPESNIYLDASISDAVCKSATGSIFTNISGAALPITYNWSNGKNTSSINNLASGQYLVTITDAKGCIVKKTLTVKESSPITVGFSNVPSSCIYAKDGAITANIFGGTAPYTYNWNNGKNTASISGLNAGYYQLFLTDANGCTSNTYTDLKYDINGNSCYCTIEGTVFHDLNENCNKDSGENGIQNIQIHCKGFGYTYTDENGHYSFKVPDGTYEISEAINSLYPLSNCQNNKNILQVTAAAGCTRVVNFGNIINPIHDTHIALWSDNLPIPGFGHTQNLVITNAGTVKENDIVSAYFTDNQIGVPTFSPNGLFSLQQTGYYTSNAIADLEPGKSQVFKVNYTVPTNIPLSTELYFKDSTAYVAPMTNWLNDNSPWNNVNQLRENVVGSFDPNFIQVSPKGLTDNGYISKNDSTLEYMVHFQNYGNYFAQNVVVKCQLNPNLEWTTLKPIFSSNPSTISLSETGLLTYTFNNIRLMPKSWNEELSKGFFTFTAKVKAGLAPLTKIENLADIYFDYNAPISTNTALNTIEKLSQNEDSVDNEWIQKVYPNPTATEINVQLKKSIIGKVDLNLFDIYGRKITNKSIENYNANTAITLDVSNYASGLYFINIAANGSTSETYKVSIIKE